MKKLLLIVIVLFTAGSLFANEETSYVKLTDESFRELIFDYYGVSTSPKITKNTVILFGADWCGPCNDYMPIYEEFSAKYNELADFYFVDVDKLEKAASSFGVRSIPETFFFNVEKKRYEKYPGMLYLDTLEEKWLALFGDVEKEE